MSVDLTKDNPGHGQFGSANCRECGRRFPKRTRYQKDCSGKCKRRHFAKIRAAKKEARRRQQPPRPVKIPPPPPVPMVDTTCLCPRCGRGHKVKMAPTLIIPRIYCETCRRYNRGAGYYEDCPASMSKRDIIIKGRS